MADAAVMVSRREAVAIATGGAGEQMQSESSRTNALTVISPIRPGWTPFARVVLGVLPQTPWGAGTELEELRFIQSARWALITDLPTATGRVGLKYDYLFFESNFNGTLAAYLEAFADILAPKMRLIWNSSFGFPNMPQDASRPVWRRLGRPIPGRPFVDYVLGASVPEQHFYSAYPDASATEVLTGLCAEAILADLRGQALAAAELGAPQRFTDAFTAAMLVLQGRPDLAPQPAESHGDRRGGLYAFTALTPITRGREEELCAALAGLGTGPASPFAQVPGVHFARWVIIDTVGDQPGQQRDGWPQAYLLTSTTADGTGRARWPSSTSASARCGISSGPTATATRPNRARTSSATTCPGVGSGPGGSTPATRWPPSAPSARGWTPTAA